MQPMRLSSSAILAWWSESSISVGLTRKAIKLHVELAQISRAGR